jgi:glycosyltransferase involved in cell wall biosynthesis
MAVNVFLSSRVWAEPLNAFGLRHHVAALYEEVFRDREVRMYPREREGGLLAAGLRHLPTLLAGDVNVLAQGYPVVTGALASWVRRNPGLIMHTWKVPGISDRRLSARAYDVLLRRVINRARAVVVANHLQRRQIEALGVACPVIFAPVTVDSRFWHPEPDKMDIDLARFELKRDSYVLTVGGTDRDETYAARVAGLLGLLYVRATYDKHSAERARLQLACENLEGHSRILVNSSHVELRALYAGARIICLPTVTRTNPAGLSSMVEAMACGALVGIPESLAEGYVVDGSNGLVLSDVPEDFAARVVLAAARVPSIRLAVRKFAEEQLNVLRVGTNLRSKLLAE